MEHTERYIRSLYPLGEPAWLTLKQQLRPVSLPKGHLVFRGNRVETALYFMERGIARAYSLRGDKDITFWIGAEGDPLISYNSYIRQKPGYENMELLEDSLLYRIDSDTLQTLFRQDVDLANWGRKLAELELVKTEEHFIHLQFKTAEERYRDLLQQRPDLIRRVPLMHLASYLDMTQVTLSRIRAKR